MATDESQLNPVGPSDQDYSASRQSVEEGARVQQPEVHHPEATHSSGPATRRAKITSPSRAEASRQNGRKSHGPRTDEGKNRSRRGALKHGLRAETLLLEAEDRQENIALQALRDVLEQQFLPCTVEQQLLLETAVHALWQKRRGLQFEARELREEMVFHGPVMDRILRYGAAADKRFFRSLAELKRLHEESRQGEPAKKSTKTKGSQDGT
jgi:hypothetical protein